jgi:hypothetical protein
MKNLKKEIRPGNKTSLIKELTIEDMLKVRGGDGGGQIPPRSIP